MYPSGYILRGWCRFVIVALISPCPLSGHDSFLGPRALQRSSGHPGYSLFRLDVEIGANWLSWNTLPVDDFVQEFPDRSCLPCILTHSRAIQTKTFGVDIGIQDVIFRRPFVYEAHIGGGIMVGAGVFKGFCKGLS